MLACLYVETAGEGQAVAACLAAVSTPLQKVALKARRVAEVVLLVSLADFAFLYFCIIYVIMGPVRCIAAVPTT